MPDERLDVRLSRQMELTRSRVEKLIRDGHATVNGKVETKPGFRVPEDAACDVWVPDAVPIAAMPEALPLSILYQDADIAVVEKPVGMVVHPAAGNLTGTLVNALLYHLTDLSGIGGALRPGIVHRLDKDTSGLLVVAKHDAAHVELSRALKARSVKRTYRAIVRGCPREPEGFIEAPIGRHPTERKRMAIVQDGRYARTEYVQDSKLRGAASLTVHIITGRTHQIRVHFASIGHPVLGDPIYGGRLYDKEAKRLMLHAWRLSFDHPMTGEPLVFETNLPDAFAQMEKKLSGA